MGLLERAQQRKPSEDTPPQTVETPSPQPATVSLLQRAQQRRKTPTPVPTAIKKTRPRGTGVEIIEEHKQLGWKHLGTHRVVYDHKLNEYRYEVIEPQLNTKEKELRKELAYLFKMLA